MKILSLERSLRDSTTSHSLWYFDKYFDGIDEIFANQLAKNTKRFKLEFSRPSHSVQLQKDKSCYQASQKLGKIHGIFEVQTCLESCPTFGKFRRCHHHLTVWLELFSKLTRTAVNHSFGARHSHPKRAKEEVQQEGRNPHGDQVNCGEICADLQMVYHLQWTPSLGRMQDKVWRDGAQTDLETPVSALFASPHDPWASCAKYASSEENRIMPKVYLLPLLHKRLGKRLGRFQNICLLVTANDTAKAVRTAFAIKAPVTNKQIWNLLLHGHNTSYTGRVVPGSLPSGKRKFRQVQIRCEIFWSFNRSSMLSLHHSSLDHIMQSLNHGIPSSLQMVSFDHLRCNHQQSVMQSFILQRFNQVASKDRLKILKKSLDIQKSGCPF